MQSELQSIVKKGNNIDHDFVNDLLSGEKVVDQLTKEDAIIIEDAINAKFRKKVEEIQEGFFKLGEKKSKYPPSIPKDKVDFNFSIAWNTRFFLRYYFHHKSYSEGANDVMNEIVIYWENGTDKGNAYGQKISDITRRYKIKSLAKSLKTLDTVLDRFLELKVPELKAYNEKVIFDKAQFVILKRKELQQKFKKYHDDYDVLRSLGSDYGVTYAESNVLCDKIVQKGKAELKRIMKLGEVAWIAPNGKNYKDLGMFL